MYFAVFIAWLLWVLETCGASGIHRIITVNYQPLAVILFVGQQSLCIYGCVAAEIAAQVPIGLWVIESQVPLKSIGLDTLVIALATFKAALGVLAAMTLSMFVQDTGITSGEFANTAMQGLFASVLPHVDL